MSEYIYYLTNKQFDLKVKEEGIFSLKCNHTGTDVEFIEEGTAFGHVHLTYKQHDGEWIKVQTETCQRKMSKHLNHIYEVCYDFEGLMLIVRYQLNQTNITYELELVNQTDQMLEIGDLSIPFPMNSNFNWGDDANVKVLRHSFISGHNSYIFWERCNGVAPYLLMTPIGDTSLEFYNMYASSVKEKRQVFKAFIYSKVEGKVAKEKGCNWRQRHTSIVLAPLASVKHGFKFTWKENYDAIREALIQEGLLDVHVVPGMTIPNDLEAKFSIGSRVQINKVEAEYPSETELKWIKEENGKNIYQVKFNRLGENYIKIYFDQDKTTILEFFSTEPLETLIRKRAAFITKRQIKDSTLWYDGLLAEWNMQKQSLLSPDNYDEIKGWRIYEVTCDDPGLSKPAFLSTKLVEYPIQDEVSALDYYIEHFVWGGLQRTEDEEFSYGIYGIPDWKTLRESMSRDGDGQLHIWRIYDYPHIALMYFNMYLVGKYYPEINLKLNRMTYLMRAYKTAVAMFTIPWELAEWSAYKTGLYNELCIPHIVEELYKASMDIQAKRLELLWNKKAKHFVLEKPDVFGSEYPFDTTGFESTYALAEYAKTQVMQSAKPTNQDEPQFTADKVHKFMTLQRKCNIACRGWLEPAYYLLGSDYRTENIVYALSYMAQMGTNGILTYALNSDYDPETEDLIRLGYASLLSSWALMNTGTKESNYGYWYEGIENDGGAGGGFEPAPYGETWLNQPHHRGSWYYSCEIDLGFCGALRAATTVVHEDSIFGLTCYGGTVEEEQQNIQVILKDGLRRRFSWVRDEETLNVEVKGVRFAPDVPLCMSKDLLNITGTFESSQTSQHTSLKIAGLRDGLYEFSLNKKCDIFEVVNGDLEISLDCLALGHYEFELYKC